MTNLEKMTFWLEKIVIGLNLCPFAIKPFNEKRIRLIESKYAIEDKIFQELTWHAEVFKNGNTTDLYFFPEFKTSFENFYELFQDIEDYLERNGLDGVQLVCFHPDFRFEGLDKNDKANCVNRSPYPCVHFLNSIEFENLNLSPTEGEKISFINEKKLNELSPKEFEDYFFYLK